MWLHMVIHYPQHTEVRVFELVDYRFYWFHKTPWSPYYEGGANAQQACLHLGSLVIFHLPCVPFSLSLFFFLFIRLGSPVSLEGDDGTRCDVPKTDDLPLCRVETRGVVLRIVCGVCIHFISLATLKTTFRMKGSDHPCFPLLLPPPRPSRPIPSSHGMHACNVCMAWHGKACRRRRRSQSQTTESDNKVSSPSG